MNKFNEIFFGTMLPKDETYIAMMNAFRSGYKYFDFADKYGNQTEIGRAIKDWFGSSKEHKREDYFFQSKVWTDDINNNKTRWAITKILQDLGLNYIDSMLIHRPSINFDNTISAWEEFIQNKNLGLIKRIGVSNFDKDQIVMLWAKTDEKPEFNQIEFNINNQRWDRIEFCQKNNITIQAYSTLVSSLTNAKINSISEKLEIPKANVIINWLKSYSIVPIVASRNEVHILKNLEYSNVLLTKKECLEIYNLNSFKNIWAETIDNKLISDFYRKGK